MEVPEESCEISGMSVSGTASAEASVFSSISSRLMSVSEEVTSSSEEIKSISVDCAETVLTAGVKLPVRTAAERITERLRRNRGVFFLIKNPPVNLTDQESA